MMRAMEFQFGGGLNYQTDILKNYLLQKMSLRCFGSCLIARHAVICQNDDNRL